MVRLIAEGGMAWVFEVIDPRLDVRRALKMLKPSQASEVEFTRFQAEAKLLARLDHPNLITPFELDQDPDTRCYYYTMTLAEGGSLYQRGRLPLDEAGPVFLNVLSALAAVHDAGIVHRDIKPSNIFRARDGRALLGDLGIARVTTGSSGLTKTGTAIGTAAFMSPEQAGGREVGPASDVFSMGLTLYQALTGESVYARIHGVDTTSGEQVLMYLGALLHGKRELDIEFPRDIPKPVARVIRRACRFNPDERYANGREMHDALEEALRTPAREGWTLPRPTLPEITLPSIPKPDWNAARERTRASLEAGRARLIEWGSQLQELDWRRVGLVVGVAAAVIGGGAGLGQLARWWAARPPTLPPTVAAAPLPPVDLPDVSAAPPGHHSAAEGAPPPAPDPMQALPPAYRELHAQLASPDVPEQAKRALVKSLVEDLSPEATAVLHAATGNGSIRVSMASIAALGPRMDDRVEARLCELLADDAWERRAWAARVLGRSQRTTALPHLEERLASESDDRVRRLLQKAVDSLRASAEAAVEGTTG
ncbi:MAG: protein kinase [Proteobacteria bacterium]|nr:protein kinase [Pseudomonadota bacterium]